MLRHLCLALLACLAMDTVAAAEASAEPSMCKSICASEQRSCRNEVARLGAIDDDAPHLALEDKSPHEKATSRAAGQPIDVRVRDQSSAQRRRVERTAACSQTYARCVRACGGGSATAPVSEVLTKRGQAKAAATR